MPTIGWNENAPADTDSAGAGDDQIRSLKTSLRQGLDDEHNWPSGGGADTGYHRRGSARPYYGLQSAVSSSGSDGRLMLTSDSSRLFAVGSGGTVLLGGWNSLSVGSTTGVTWPQRACWAMEFGRDVTGSGADVGRLQVTFPNSGFSGVPYVIATAARAPAGAVIVVHDPTGRTASSFSAFVQNASGAGFASLDVDWISIGTRTL